ncbi:hypothetical protein, partial [Burkholderia gladioli]|uniref:hypothetical protein n=1 Tax=Burkholderia gladioli TaxID=28095 RepID=UPI001ABAB353
TASEGHSLQGRHSGDREHTGSSSAGRLIMPTDPHTPLLTISQERSEWEVSRHLARRTLEGHLRRMLFKRMVDVAASIPVEKD